MFKRDHISWAYLVCDGQLLLTGHITVKLALHERFLCIWKLFLLFELFQSDLSTKCTKIVHGDLSLNLLYGYYRKIFESFFSFQRSGDVYKRIDETRVNADDIIDQLING